MPTSGAVTTVLCAEYNAVRAGQLWPRSLLTPFTDNADLTPADQRAYTSYARTERHKSFQNIDVSFGKPPNPDPPNQNPEHFTPAGDRTAAETGAPRPARRCHATLPRDLRPAGTGQAPGI